MTTFHPWHARASELADWALARFFVRRDRYGGYYARDGETRKCSKPTDGPVPNVVSRSVLLRHFRATRPEDVCGAYLLTPEPSVGRCVAVDIDAHDDSADPDANTHRGVELYGRLAGLGFRPLLARWAGSCHLYALFAQDQSGEALYRFGRMLVDDHPIETFPKQTSVPKDGYGNWLRVVGRHHTRDQWAEVFDGSQWLAGAPAVAHLLSLTGDDVSICDFRFPISDSKTADAPAPAPIANRKSEIANGVDVLADFNRSATLDEVVSWHERQGHRVLRRRPDRVELVRAGKKGSESFNVAICGGVAITYNFSTGANLPAAKGLNPAQVRCWYECGRCDSAALCEFADYLRSERGLAPRRRPPAAATPASGSLEDRLAAVERRVAQLEADRAELIDEVLDLRERLGKRYCRVN